MKNLARAGVAGAMMVSLAGCAQLGGSPPPPPAAVGPAPPYAGLASGVLGASLDAADRTAANNAEIAALNSGDRKTWRGDDGTYGYVAPSAANGDCRDFTHTVYINGRPQVGKGTACKADGGWKLKS
ncbi:hypothetical protein [Rhodoblastus sp.]|uniref:hypothetical protein n=1 Tax=Rhodoblastus sp. TaxID=1962975 RepID=UPI002606EFD9|nr:hypothetical protein [Rhodoblastus sp.]